MRIPSEAGQRVRDVVRWSRAPCDAGQPARETFQREILTSRHYIVKFLATRGFVFREGTNWCTPHLKWLQHLTTDGSPLATENRLICREYHALLLYTRQRREELDRQIERLAELPALAPMVTQRQCVRGISGHSTMVLATEIVDGRRFERPAQLACYLGLIPREDSSGDRQRLGSITKAGNIHCRHGLVQAARGRCVRLRLPVRPQKMAIVRPHGTGRQFQRDDDLDQDPLEPAIVAAVRGLAAGAPRGGHTARMGRALDVRIGPLDLLSACVVQCEQSLGLRAQYRREWRGGEPGTPTFLIQVGARRDEILRREVAMNAILESRAASGSPNSASRRTTSDTKISNCARRDSTTGPCVVGGRP